jgi:hemoglobin-like flavoprotein
MTQHQINLVKSSWAEVSTMDLVTVGILFYDRLAELSPDTKPLFGISMADQSRKIMAMLGYIINKLDGLEEIIDEVEKLAQRHVHYGVKVEHYTAGGEALLWTLEKGLAEQWNEELKEAWTVCYNILSSAMISAAEYTKQNAA